MELVHFLKLETVIASTLKISNMLVFLYLQGLLPGQIQPEPNLGSQSCLHRQGLHSHGRFLSVM